MKRAFGWICAAVLACSCGSSSGTSEDEGDDEGDVQDDVSTEGDDEDDDGRGGGGAGGAGGGGGGSAGRDGAADSPSQDAGISDAADEKRDAGPPDGAPDVVAPARNACVLPLGDSITQGAKDRVSYRYWLWKTIQEAGVPVNFIGSTRGGFTGSPTYPDPTFDRDHEGHWGWRADEVLRDLPTWLTKYTPGIALVHLGSNDAFQGNPPDGTIDELRRIIGLLRGKNPRVAVLLAKILPTVHPDNNSRFTMVNDRIPALASELHTADAPVIVVDHNADFDVAALTYDGIHPNEAGEKLMAGRWWKALEPLLRAAGPCP